jgi:hypothetical protein
MHMSLPWVPEPNRALDLLWPALAFTHDAVEEASTTARRYHEERQQEMDVVFAAGLVRHEVKDRLRKRGLHVEDEESGETEPLQPQALANNGLCLKYRQRHLRILKSLPGGAVPPPGPSKRRQAFWNQPAASPLFDSLVDCSEELSNFIVLWMVDWRYLFKGLRLVLPRTGGISVESVETYWDITVPNPIQKMHRPSVTPEDVAVDLDIEYMPLTESDVRTNAQDA